MSVNSTAEYFALLEKSGAIQEELLDQVKGRYAELPDAKHLARKLVDRNVLTDWQARFLLSGRHRLKVGQYLLLNRFAKQVVGDRFLAIHKQLDRKVDVLIFPKDATHNKKLFKQFLNQASVVAELDHANLLHLYDIDQDNGRYFLVFEHDDGDSLRNVAAGSLDPMKIASIAKQALEGISYAHKKSVIHGKLDESQIRVDQKGRVVVRNIGLAKLLDELQDPDADIDEFAITPDPADDVVAVGRISKNLFKQHVGKPVTDLDKSLYGLFGKLAGTTDVNENQTDGLVNELSEWILRFERENTSSAMATPASRRATTESSDAVSNGSGKKPNANASTASPTGSDKANTRKNAKLIMAIAAVAGIVTLGGGQWFASSFWKSAAQTSETNSDKNPVSNRDNSSTPADKNGTADPQAKKSAKGFRPKSLPDPTAASDPGLKKNSTPDTDVSPKGKTDSDEKKDETVEPPAWSNVKPSDPSTSDKSTKGTEKAESSTNQDVVANTPTEPPKTIEFAGAEGLPLIPWQDAKNMVDKEIVAYGTITDVGSSRSGKTRYINFDKDDRSAFKLIVRAQDLKVEEEVLRERFLNMHICVKGKVELFRNDPQIALEELEQVMVLPALPNAETKLLGKSPSTTASVAKSGVFAGMAGGLQIPELTRDNPDFERKLLGPIDIGDDPMGMFLTVPDQIHKRPIWFGIERDQTGRRWEISFAAKTANAEETKKPVAEINVQNNQIYFSWIKTDNIDPIWNYLQNCLLEIKAREETKTVILRKPIAARAIVLDAQRPSFSEKLELTYLPQPESIFIEILPLPKAEFETQVNDYGNVLSVDQDETVVYFDKDPTLQFFRLLYSADISTAIKIESVLQINTPNKPMLLNKRNLKSIEESLLGLQARINQENAAAIAYEAPRGQITKHKARVKQLAKDLEKVNAQVAAFQIAKPVAARVVGRQLKYRVYFAIDDIQFDLVSPNIENDSSSAESE